MEFLLFPNPNVPESGIYELVNGEIVGVDATRAHKNVARFLVKCLDGENERLGLGCIVDKDIKVRTVNSTVFVYLLVEGIYQVQGFRGSDRIISPTFTELDLTVDRVIESSKIQKL